MANWNRNAPRCSKPIEVGIHFTKDICPACLESKLGLEQPK